jgi:hypothetical protein
MGTFCYTPHTGVWKECLLQNRQDGDAGNTLQQQQYIPTKTLYCDRTGTVWIGTLQGLFRSNPQHRDVATPVSATVSATAVEGLERHSVYYVHEDTNGFLWIGIEGKEIGVYDIRRRRLTLTPPVQLHTGDVFVHNFADNDGMTVSPVTMVAGVMDIPYHIEAAGGNARSEMQVIARQSPLPVLKQTCIKGIDTHILARDIRRGYYWLYVSDYGANRYQTGLYCVHETAEDLPRLPVLQGKVTAFLRDRYGVLWVGREQQGLTMLFPSGMDYISDRAEMGDAIAVLTDSRGRLWQGTRTGLFCATFSQTRIQTHTYKDGLRWERVAFPAPRSRLRAVVAVRETSDGRILCATSEGLFAFDESSRVLRPLPAYVRSVGTEEAKLPVQTLLCDSHDNLWLNIPLRGLVRCAPDGSVLQRWKEGGGKEDIPRLPIFALAEDAAHNVWIGTMNGVLRWYRRSERLEHDGVEIAGGAPGSGAGLSPAMPVSVVYAEANNRILAGVDVQGFAAIVPKSADAPEGQYRMEALALALPDARVTQICRAGKQYWWTTYTGGVYTADTAQFSLTPSAPMVRNAPFDASFGAPVRAPTLMLPLEAPAEVEASPPVNQGSMTLGRDSSCYFDYFGNLVRVRPGEAHPLHDTARVLCASWYRNDSLMADVPASGDTLLCAYNGSFSLECAVISLLRPERHVLEYRLEGLEESWHLASDKSARLIRYAMLQPGVYRLLVRSRSSDDNLQSPQTLELSLLVPYPVWRLWYVQGGFGALVVVMIAWMSRRYERSRSQTRLTTILAEQHRKRDKERKGDQEEREKEQLRRNALDFQLKTLRLQMNPHFTFNTLALIQEQILLAPDEALASIGIFTDLMRQMLTQSDKETIAMTQELRLLKRYMDIEQMRSKNQIHFALQLLPAHTDWAQLWVPPFIVQPFVENAVRHGLRPMLAENAPVQRDCRLSLEMHRENGFLRCVIEDNGIGRAASAEKKRLRALAAEQANADAARNEVRDEVRNDMRNDTPASTVLAPVVRREQEHLSIATVTTAARLELLEKVYSIRLSITYDDLMDEGGTAAGTRVTILIPVREGDNP